MGKVTIYLHKDVLAYCDSLSDLMDTSRSEIVEDMIEHIRDEDLEEDVWGDTYTEAKEEED